MLKTLNEQLSVRMVSQRDQLHQGLHKRAVAPLGRQGLQGYMESCHRVGEKLLGALLLLAHLLGTDLHPRLMLEIVPAVVGMELVDGHCCEFHKPACPVASVGTTDRIVFGPAGSNAYSTRSSDEFAGQDVVRCQN
ncbi:hypothetical protein [Nonomuraea sp. NPDC005650]|uniref:hypothetical protein n=1 Tax=Nonomuraea sp. NPDC005650 TaxID=3157045 RepID=UPI0033AAA9BF